MLTPRLPALAVCREDLQKSQQARRCLAQAAPPGRDCARATGKRPSAEEWLGLESSPAPVAVATGSAGRRQSAAEWCADAVDAAPGEGSPAQGEGPAAHTEEDAEDLEEEDSRGTCAEERGHEDDAVEEGWQRDDSEERWPKLDINSQHFSSKPEPIILCEDPPAQVPMHVAKLLPASARARLTRVLTRPTNTGSCWMAGVRGFPGRGRRNFFDAF